MTSKDYFKILKFISHKILGKLDTFICINLFNMFIYGCFKNMWESEVNL